MFGGNVRIDKHLLERVKKMAKTAGYESADEFVTHCLEKELEQLEGADGGEDEQAILDRLRGLGYIE